MYVALVVVAIIIEEIRCTRGWLLSSSCSSRLRSSKHIFVFRVRIILNCCPLDPLGFGCILLWCLMLSVLTFGCFLFAFFKFPLGWRFWVLFSTAFFAALLLATLAALLGFLSVGLLFSLLLYYRKSFLVLNRHSGRSITV